MKSILPNLFLGDRWDASDSAVLREHGITHIVNCSKELPCRFESEFAYLWLPMEDPDPTFGEKIAESCRFIDEGRAAGKVLVHCTAGVSRSAAIILAYLCQIDGSMQLAADRLRKAAHVGIHEDLILQLVEFRDEELTAAQVKTLQRSLGWGGPVS